MEKTKRYDGKSQRTGERGLEVVYSGNSGRNSSILKRKNVSPKKSCNESEIENRTENCHEIEKEIENVKSQDKMKQFESKIVTADSIKAKC